MYISFLRDRLFKMDSEQFFFTGFSGGMYFSPGPCSNYVLYIFYFERTIIVQVEQIV